MANLIVLTGTSSAGKSTLARQLQKDLPEPHVVIDIDTFLAGRPIDHPRWEQPDVQQAVYRGFHAAIRAFAEAGNPLVVATIVPWHDPSFMAELVQRLLEFDVVFVGVRCPLPIVEERERQRPEVPDGAARSQFDHVHRYAPYDLEVDTAIQRPTQAAAAIRNCVGHGKRHAWARLAREIGSSQTT